MSYYGNNKKLSDHSPNYGSIDSSVSDVVAMNSSIKSWLYGDVFKKPAEMVMCGPTFYGGLGVLSGKYRAQAALIRSFRTTLEAKCSLLRETRFVELHESLQRVFYQM